MSQHVLDRTSALDHGLAELVDQIASQLQSGEQVDIEALVQAHPKYEEQLRQLWPALQLLAEAATASAARGESANERRPDEPAPGLLGDFRIVREIGRGGMGVVYEAEQISLGRRVALKVLPFAAALDSRQLQRFRNEAHAAAQLHHTNIVPVYAVGTDRGVHYYAMQFIEGQTLAAAIHELRAMAGLDAGEDAPRGEVSLAAEMVSGRWAGAPGAVDTDAASAYAPPPPLSTAPSPLVREGRGAGLPVKGRVGVGDSPLGERVVHEEADTTKCPGAAISTERSTRSPAFFRTVARLGVQAAEALEHAHAFGVIHRDIKPANLLVDARGNLWITDFGLAQVQSDTKLTITGDLIGTLRYMSPEQALAKRVVVDHRTDIYSLGVTLYELLTLEPAFSGRDRQELLRQIAFEEAKAPRKISRNIPPELETIVLKAISKNPAERYATAQELADDLERYLKDEPIRARRPNLLQRARKWSRRHKAIVWSVGVCFFVAVIAAGVTTGWIAGDRAARWEVAERKAAEALADVDRLLNDDRPEAALSAAHAAEAILQQGGSHPQLAPRVQQWLGDLRMLLTLEEICLKQAALGSSEGAPQFRFDLLGASEPYREAFAEYGLPLEKVDPRAAAAHIRGRPQRIRDALLAALNDLALLEGAGRGTLGIGGRAGHIYETHQIIAQIAPGSAADGVLQVGDRITAMALGHDGEMIEVRHLHENDRSRFLHGEPGNVVRLQVVRPGASESQTVTLAFREKWPWLRQLLEVADADPWRSRLRVARWEIDPTRRRAALEQLAETADAIRQPAHCLAWLGGLLGEVGASESAARLLQRAQQQQPADFWVNLHLAGTLENLTRLDEAIGYYRAAVAARPQSAGARLLLAHALSNAKQHDEALAMLRKAAEIQPESDVVWLALGSVLQEQAEANEAIAAFRRAIAIRPNGAAWNNLGHCLAGQKNWNEAEAAFGKAIEIDPNLAEAWYGLAMLLWAQKQRDDAVAACRKAVDIRPSYAAAWADLGSMFVELANPDDAVSACRKAIDIEPQNGKAWCNLGAALAQKRDLDAGAEALDKALEIDPRDAMAWNNLAFILSQKGEHDEALDALKKAVAIEPKEARFWTNLAVALEQCGELNEAVEAVHNSVNLDPESAKAWFGLGILLAKQGKLDDAIAAYQKAIELKPDLAEAHCNLGHALRDNGRFAEALNALKRGHELGSREPTWQYPSARWIEECERLVALDARLSRVLAGQQAVADAREGLAFADVCYRKRRFELAVRFFEEALAHEPALAQDVTSGHRYNAACAAARAGAGEGDDARALTDDDRARRRQQAIDWLRADLAQHVRALENASPSARAALAQTLQHWLNDRDLKGLRDNDDLAVLPPEEREACVRLWNDVRELMIRARRAEQ